MTHGRKACLAGARCEPQTLGEATYCLVHHSTMPAKALADAAGVRYGYLLDAANPDRDEVQCQARLLLTLTRLTGNCIAMDFLERQLGRVAFGVPRPQPDQADLVDRTATALGEFGELLEELRASLADRRVTLEESQRVARQASDAIAAIAALDALVQSKVTAPLAGSAALRSVG